MTKSLINHHLDIDTQPSFTSTILRKEPRHTSTTFITAAYTTTATSTYSCRGTFLEPYSTRILINDPKAKIDTIPLKARIEKSGSTIQ